MLMIIFSQLDAHYPHFPSEEECKRSIMDGNVNQEAKCGSNLYLLPTLFVDWERLQLGGALLPDLVEFYTWLHKNLAHMLTIKRASAITIGRVVELVERKKGKYIRKLYNTVKEQYNKYVDLIGGAIGAGACAAMHRENKITKITDDIPILHFLSGMLWHA